MTDFSVTYSSSLSKSLKQFLEYTKENEARIAERCEKVTVDLITKFKSKTREIRPFPDEEDALVPKLDTIHEEISEDFRSILREYGSSSSLAKGKIAFKVLNHPIFF